ncbi:MAG: sensor histidine kinase [Micrococcales bacterium]|nr:sensor histidine kinase [Micrococcales bacterium]
MVREARPGPAVSEGDEFTPWGRYVWVIQSVWLVFLVFPVLAVIAEPDPWWLKAIGLAITAAFGVAYAAGLNRLDQLELAGAPHYRLGARYFGLLTALALLTVPTIGVNALSFVPFVVAFGMFALPVGWAFLAGALGFVVAAATAIFIDPHEGTWIIVIIIFAVGGMTGGIRVMAEKGADYENMSRELAVTAERERVARDVHDVLGHSLTVVTVKAELAERLVELDPARARAELVEIQALSRRALMEIRETVGGLRVARLDDELIAARTALAGAGIAADVPADSSAVDPRCRTVLAWVLREAVTNVVRHSGAGTCRVELDGAMLRVVDDGRGLDGRPEGNGLRGLRERVRAAGGALTVATRLEGHGTELEVRM